MTTPIQRFLTDLRASQEPLPPKLYACGGCGTEAEADDCRECYVCCERTCEGCAEDNGACSYCGASWEYQRAIAVQDAS